MRWLRNTRAQANLIDVIPVHDLGPGGVLTPRDPTFTMPEPWEALQAAESYARAAVAMTEDDAAHRDTAISQLMTVLLWQARFGDDVDDSELAKLHSSAREDVDHLTSRIGQVAKEILRLGDTGAYVALSELLDQLAPELAVAALGLALTRPSGHDPDLILELAELRGQLIDQYGDEQDRVDQAVLEVGLIRSLYGSDLDDVRGLPEDAAFDDIVALVSQLSVGPVSTALARAALLIYLANLLAELPSGTHSGVEALDAARRASPQLVERHHRTTLFIEAKLTFAVGAHAIAEDKPVESASAFVKALADFADLQLYGRVGDCLAILNSLAPQLDMQAAFDVLGGLLALNTYGDLDQNANRLVQLICARLLHRVMTTGVTQDFLIVHAQIAKGWRLHVALAQPPPAIRALDEEGRQLLAKVAPAEGHALRDPDMLAPGFIDDETILVSWSDTAVRRPSAGPSDRLRNRRRRFDKHLNALLKASGEVPTPMPLEEVQNALDARTVLLVYFSGGWTDDDIGTAFLLVTHDELSADIRIDNAPSCDVWLRADDLTVATSPIGVFVAEFRRRIQSDPLTDLVDDDVKRNLAGSVGSYLGRLRPHLEELARGGKDRLMIVPHGPLHYYPFHLVGPVGAPLAATWTVSYLPNLGLLRNRAAGGAVPVRGAVITSFGVTYRDDPRPRLAELPRATVEATAVAALFGAEAVPESSATKANVLHALRHSRFVHISAHGEHDVDAPAFQCLYLAGTGVEGMLFAHELLTQDLRGLELVTLSACETALGRFDRQDNLQGLPAALLLAGARAIVGTLWQVSDEAASVFFPALYRRLAARSDVFDAFRDAQATTRAAFPQYWDWGAFYLIGGTAR